MRKRIQIILCLLIVLTSNKLLVAQGGNTPAAAAASPITLPFNTAATTCGDVDNYNPLSPYGIPTSGEDWLYYFCAPTSGVIDVFMSNSYGIMPGIFVFNTAPNAGGSNWTSTSFTGANYINSLVSLTVTAGSCYYIMIDNDSYDNDWGDNCFSYNLTIQYHTVPPAAVLQPACSNIGYDDGSLNGWIGTTGVVQQGAVGAQTPLYTPLYYTTSATQHVITSGAGVDPIGGFPVVNPGTGPNSIRLGDLGNYGTASQYFGGIPGNGGATLEQKFTVTAANALFVYYYAVVIQDAGTDHTNPEQPFFKTDIYDCTGAAVPCGQYLVTGGPGIPGFVSAGNNMYYKTWSPVAVDLTPFIGTCVTVRYTVGDCTRGAHFAYAYIDAQCSPLAITGVNQICPNRSTTLTAPTGLFTYSWSPGGQTTQSVVVSPTVATTYSVELTSYTNCKTFLNYPVTIFPAAVNSVNSATVCNGVSAALTTTVNNGAGTYTWQPSGGNASSTNVAPSSTTIYTVTYTDSNGCQDTAMSRVTVNPLPTMVVPTNSAICHNANVASTVFTSTVAGTTFSWTNSNPAIGLASSGTANTPAFTAINTGASPVTAIISVTPTANSCVGPPISYTITVNPIPNVNSVLSSTYCSGVTVPATAFSGSVTSTTVTWSNTNTAIGLAATGVGNAPSFGSLNNTSAAINGVVTVTPSAYSCIGTPTNFTITVNPIPNVDAVTSATYCSGNTVAASAFTGSVTGTTFNWSNNNTSIGLGASGVGNTPSFTANNTTANSINGIITVLPSANSCTGTPTSYSVVVNPIPNINAVSNATYCSGVSVPASAYSGSVASTTFSWTNNNSSIGLGLNGIGNTPIFVASNTGTSPVLSVVTVTPGANSCIGSPINYTITINPIPSVSVPASSSYCNGAVVPAQSFTSNILGSTFNWSNTNSSIGLASSGNGNTPPFSSVNTGANPLTGVVTVTPSINGCVGNPASFSITINPTPLAPTVIGSTVCPTSSATLTATAPTGTFNWYDAASGGSFVGTGSTYVVPNLTLSAIYYVNSTNSFGCVGPLSPVNATVYNGLSVVATPNQTICVGASATLGVNPNGGGYIISWNEPSSPNFSSIYNPVVSPVATTNYTVNITSPDGCTGAAQTQVYVNSLPVANAGNSIALCDGQSATIGAASVSGYSYQWSPVSGLSSSTISNPLVLFSNIGNTQSINHYTVTVTYNGCQSKDSTTVVVNPLPVSDAGNPITLCANQSGSIGSANVAGYSYSWIPTTNLSSSTVSNPTILGVNNTASPNSTSYTVVTTDVSSGCQSNDNVVVTVLPLPTVNISPVSSVCEGTSNIPIVGSIGGSATSVLWSGGSGSYSPSNSSLNFNYTPSAAEYANGNVTLTLTASAQAPCQNVSTNVTISFYKNPVVNFIVDNPKGCPEHCVNFTDQSTVAAPDFIQSWVWSFGDGGSSTSQNPYYCYKNSGVYSVTLTAISNHMCSSSLTIPQMIEVYKMPIASFVPNPYTTIITDPNFTFQNTSQGATSYVWDFGDFSSPNNSSTLTDPSHQYTYIGVYNVNLVATSADGCIDRASVQVEVKPEFTFYIPNAFTPNNSDGINDIFTGMGIGIEEYEMWVFDRWGERIFYTDDIKKGWNGTRQGKPEVVQQDVYVWKVKLKDVFGKNHDYIGHVTLLK